jgi:hypothetical protein
MNTLRQWSEREHPPERPDDGSKCEPVLVRMSDVKREPKPTESIWKLRLSNLVLELCDPLDGHLLTYVDLEECLTDGECFHWLCHLAIKRWGTDDVIAGLLRSFREVLGFQYPPFGPLTKREVREQAIAYARTHPANVVDEGRT